MNNADYSYIKELWRVHFGESIASEREESFRRINENPFSAESYNYYVMEEGSRIIGYEGVMPYEFNILDSNYEGYVYQDNMIDPAFRGKGMGTKLVSDVLSHTPRFSIAVWMNAPNARVFEKCGWKPVHSIYRYVRVYNLGPRINTRSKLLNRMISSVGNFLLLVSYAIQGRMWELFPNRFSVSLVQRFDDEIDALFHNVKKEFLLISDRTHQVLNWKFPQASSMHFTRLICRRGAKVTGYMVFLIRSAEKGRRTAVIYDFLCSPNDTGVFSALLSRSIAEIEKFQPDVIEILCSDKRFDKELKKCLFVKMEDNKIALKYIHEEGLTVGEETLSDGSNWFFTYGDGDKVFWET